MICKCFPRRGVGRTRGRARYIGNREHEDHLDLASLDSWYEGIPLGGEVEMLLYFCAEARDLHRITSSGRPREITSWEFIIRTPEGMFPTPKERKAIEKAMREEFDIQISRNGWHNHKDGSADLHVLALNRNSRGGALKSVKDPDMRRKMIAVMDRVHDQINAARALNGLPRMRTVKDVRKRVSQEKNRETLPHLVVRKAKEKGLTEWRDVQTRIPLWVAEAGHKVVEIDDKILKVTYKGAKRKCGHKWENLERDFRKGVTPERESLWRFWRLLPPYPRIFRFRLWRWRRRFPKRNL